MKKRMQLIALLPIILIATMSLIGCTMKSHPIEVNIVNANNESNIYDNIFRLGTVDETLNYIFYRSRTKKSWLDGNENEKKVISLDKELGTNFYQDFRTRSVDTFIYKFVIKNEFLAEKLNFNGVNTKVIEGITQKETDNQTPPKVLNFDVYFQGTEISYHFTGSVNWKYIITQKVTTTKKSEFSFFWKFDSEVADLKFTSLKKVT